MQHVAELAVAEDQTAHRRRRFDRGGPGPVVDERDLAEEIARAKSALALRSVHLSLALEDDEEVTPAFPFLCEHAAGGDVDFVGARGDEGKLFVGAARKEGYRAQSVDAGVSHGAEFSRERPP